MKNHNTASHTSELLAVLKEDGSPTGIGVPREIAHSDGILHGGSHTVLYRKENGPLQILLQRRSRSKDSFPGCLDLSSAGHMEFGSDFKETALRELREELGIDAKEEDLTELFTVENHAEREFHGRPFRNREINRVYCLPFNEPTRPLSLQASEVEEVLWFSAEEIQKMLRENDPMLCTDPAEMEQILKALTHKETSK